MPLPRFPAPGSPGWEPLLLRVPESVTRARQEWVPILIRDRMITTTGLLAVFLALQFLIPARLVISGMGAIGRPSVAVGILLGFLWLVTAVRARQLPAGRQPIRWAVGVFLAVQLLGHVVGMDRLPTEAQARAADQWLILSMASAGVTLAVADGVRTRDEVDRVLRLLVLFASLMSVVGMLQFTGVVDLTRLIRIPGLQLNSELIGVATRGSQGIPRVAGTANHFIEFGVVLALVLPLALHFAFFSPPGRTRLWRWATVGVVAVGIPLSVSRSAFVTVLVAMLFMAGAWPWRLRYNLAVMSVLAVAAFHTVNRGVLGTIRALFSNAENDPSVQVRIERTETVMTLWQQRPVLGWGAGMVTPDEFLLLDNQVFMFLIAGGVVGVVAFLALFMVPYFLGRSIRLRGQDQETRHLGHTLSATMPAAVVASGTFDSFSFATFVAVVCVLVGAVGALWRVDGTTVERPLQCGSPDDLFVAPPLTADLRHRLHEAWGARGEGRARMSGGRHRSP